MKSKFFVFIIILIFSSMLAVSAHDNLTIPENYTIVNESDNFTLLESDQYHSISISIMDNDTDKELLKHLLENSMYDFTYRENYTKGSYDVEENWYNYEYQRGILYFCDNGDELIVIDYKVPVLDDLSDSPVEVILDGWLNYQKSIK